MSNLMIKNKWMTHTTKFLEKEEIARIHIGVGIQFDD